MLWTRDLEAPADGACVYVPARVARDLFHVSCPPASVLHARAATRAERKGILVGFRSSELTPYARNALSLSHVCVSRLNRTWAGGVASFESGSTVYVFFRDAKPSSGGWRPVFESLLQQAPLPPVVDHALARLLRRLQPGRLRRLGSRSSLRPARPCSPPSPCRPALAAPAWPRRRAPPTQRVSRAR